MFFIIFSGIRIPPKFHRVLLCFSARQNMNKLLSVSQVQPAIDAAHGPRFLFMLFIIMGHRITTFGGHALFNSEYEEEVSISHLQFAMLEKNSVNTIRASGGGVH